MLRLNPGDNQGLRYILINWLLVESDVQAAQVLIDQYPDDIAASWRYSRALLSFLRHGAGRRANKALREALEWNPFVVFYLMGALPQPPRPALMQFQDPTEAAAYLYEGGIEAWTEHPAAVEWLADQSLHDLQEIVKDFPDLTDE
jgi:hypothetical protein